MCKVIIKTILEDDHKTHATQATKQTDSSNEAVQCAITTPKRHDEGK